MVVPIREAPMDTFFVAATAKVVTVNVALELPAGIVTVAGTLTEASALDSATVVSADTAPPRVTVPVTTVAEPPFTEAGEKVNVVGKLG